MNQTLFLSQLRVIILVGIAYSAGKGWLSPADSSAITSVLAPVGVIAGPWIWSIYSNINMKLVPHASVAIDPHAPSDASAPIGASVAGKVVAAMLAALALALLALPQGAMAQGAKPGCDPLNLKPGCKAAAVQASVNSLKSIITKPMQDLVDFISNGLDDAASLSIAIPDLQDGNGYACWTQLKQAGAVFKAHPVPLTLNVAADLEAVRLVHMTATRVCNNPACTQVFNEAGNVIAAAAPIKSPLPNVTQLCAQVPPIAIVAPVITAAPPTVTPAAAPADQTK